MKFELLQAVRIDTIAYGGTKLLDEYGRLRGLVTGHGKMNVAGVELDATECVWSNGRESMLPDRTLLKASLSW